MKRLVEEYELNYISPTIDNIFTEDALLFDIECLGLSPKKSPIYLIGCAYRKNTRVTSIQLFAESISDEYDILNEFEDILKSFNTVISFNGTRFDAPFIMERMQRQFMGKSSLPDKNHIDLYLGGVKCKDLLSLPNYKQKTIEEFLGIYRDDKYNGGELIQVYMDYLKDQDPEQERLLLLHNFEDVKGMIPVIDIYAYRSLYDIDEISDIIIDKSEDYIAFNGKLPVNVPKAISKSTDNYQLLISDDTISCSFRIYETVLYTYMKDYKNYVYLPYEDIIVPKQLAESIDKSQKEKCTKENCRIASNTTFIKLPKSIVFDDSIHVFKENYSEKQAYLRVDDISHKEAAHILKYIVKH